MNCKFVIKTDKQEFLEFVNRERYKTCNKREKAFRYTKEEAEEAVTLLGKFHNVIAYKAEV